MDMILDVHKERIKTEIANIFGYDDEFSLGLIGN